MKPGSAVRPHKNIYDIINEEHPVKDEIKSIDVLFSKSPSIIKREAFSQDESWSFEGYAEIHFIKWGGRGTCISLSQLKKYLKIDSHLFDNPSEEQVISYLEYVINMHIFVQRIFRLQLVPGSHHIDSSLNQALADNIAILLSQLNYCLYDKDDFTVILVPNKPEVNEVVELTDDMPLQLAVIEYNHVNHRNNLEVKRNILLKLAHDFEGWRNKLKENDAWKQLESDLGFLFNKLDIRHNKTDGDKAEPVIQGMSDKDKLMWYDKTYQLYLTARLALEYRSDFKQDIDSLKEAVKR